MTDSSGNIVESYRYDAWGRTTVYGASGVAMKSSAIGNRYCWQGREYSYQTGLYYFRARFYDPVAGRWLSNDPIGISGGLNQYCFCGNNPVNFSDPFGLCEKPSAWENYQHSMDGFWDRLGEPIHNFRNNIFFLWSDIRDGIGFPIAPPNNPTTISQSCMRDSDYLVYVIGAWGKTGKGGIKLGPSGKPVIHRPFSSTLKGAKDAARQAGQGAPMNHSSPQRGGSHFHPTDGDGNKIPGSPHYEYP